jgi:hypothetical protein
MASQNEDNINTKIEVGLKEARFLKMFEFNVFETYMSSYRYLVCTSESLLKYIFSSTENDILEDQIKLFFLLKSHFYDLLCSLKHKVLLN